MNIYIVVCNGGGGPLMLSNISIPADSILTQGIDKPIGAYSWGQMVINLPTDHQGTFTDSVSFDTNDTKNSHFSFTITGTILEAKPPVALYDPASKLKGFGSSLAGIPDVDGDGLGDIAVGDQFATSPATAVTRSPASPRETSS